MEISQEMGRDEMRYEVRKKGWVTVKRGIKHGKKRDEKRKT